MKFSAGNIPEIKPRGFMIRMYNSETCENGNGIVTFVTDRMCQNSVNEKMNLNGILNTARGSSFTQYNIEMKQAEIVTYDSRDCTGNVANKIVYPLGKCIKAPTGNQYFKIEK
jgi:hypothetical protein